MLNFANNGRLQAISSRPSKFKDKTGNIQAYLTKMTKKLESKKRHMYIQKSNNEIDG